MVDDKQACWHITIHPCRRSPALWEDTESYLHQLIKDVAKRMGFEIVKVVVLYAPRQLTRRRRRCSIVG